MDKKLRRYYIDWWTVRKSVIYWFLAFIAVVVLVTGSEPWLWKNNWLISSIFKSFESQKAPKNSAVVISFEGDAKIIRVVKEEDENVIKSTYLQTGDSIKTKETGRAQIRMVDESTFSVQPNSDLVVLENSSSMLGENSIQVKLDNGRVLVKTQDQNENSKNFVVTRQSKNRLLSQTEADFNFNPQTSNSEIRISRGQMESIVNGKTFVVRGNKFVSINKDNVVFKEDLLGKPILLKPSPSKRIFSNRTNVVFLWEKPTGQSDPSYNIQISKSPFFTEEEIILERLGLSNPKFILNSLGPGIYYWRVRASLNSGQISDWSEIAKFSIVRIQKLKRIEVSDWKIEEIGNGVYIINGITNPGNIVRVLNRHVLARADGSFSIQVASSLPWVSVEIRNDTGNKHRYKISFNSR